jgi:hypothetical protein
MGYPTQNHAGRDADVQFVRDLLKIAIAELEAQISSDRKDNDLIGEPTFGKQR